ncbi:MAG: FUSC family protein [Clostridium sp.]|uniref:FUSC family protein n=1 Tax=Clostridium sp. TaxID=1506 RepID=UPI003F2B6F1E
MKIFKGKELVLRTIVYALAVLVFFGLWGLLGPGKAFIGATIAKGSLVLMNTDLTGNKLRSTIVFLIVFVYIGLFSFISSLNIFLGLFINFFSIFILAYNFTSNIKQWIWRPFVLGYLYLLIEPGTFKELPVRLIVLAFGALFLMLTQIIVNKNRFKKRMNKNLDELLDKISMKIDVILEGKEVLDNTFKVSENVNEIVDSIYKKRIDPIFITKGDNEILNLTLYIERLNYLLKEINIDLHNDIELNFMKDLKRLILEIKNIQNKEEKNLNIIQLIDNFIEKHKDKEDYYIYEVLQNLFMLKENLNMKDYSKRDILLNRRLRKEITTVFNFKISKKSLRFSFAFRAAVLLAGSYFIVSLLKIEEGKWIVFTIYAVIEPFFEDSKKRFPKRFKGTVLGIIVFALIYLLVGNIIIEGTLFVILYYIYVISKDFQIKTMCTAAVSLGLFSIATETPGRGVLLRISFVALGIIIGYLGTKYIFPYDIKKALRNLIKNYNSLSNEILDFSIGGVKNIYYYRLLGEKMSISKLYESKIIGHNAVIKDKDIDRFVYNQRILNNTIYFTIYFFKEEGVKVDVLDKINYDIRGKNEEEVLIKVKNEFKEKFFEVHDNKEKLAFLNMQRIVVRLKESEKLTEKLLKKEW